MRVFVRELTNSMRVVACDNQNWRQGYQTLLEKNPIGYVKNSTTLRSSTTPTPRHRPQREWWWFVEMAHGERTFP